MIIQDCARNVKQIEIYFFKKFSKREKFSPLFFPAFFYRRPKGGESPQRGGGLLPDARRGHAGGRMGTTRCAYAQGRGRARENPCCAKTEARRQGRAARLRRRGRGKEGKRQEKSPFLGTDLFFFCNFAPWGSGCYAIAASFLASLDFLLAALFLWKIPSAAAPSMAETASA